MMMDVYVEKARGGYGCGGWVGGGRGCRGEGARVRRGGMEGEGGGVGLLIRSGGYCCIGNSGCCDHLG